MSTLNKVILQSFMIVLIILTSNLRAEAITGVWDGDTNNIPNGWYLGDILGLTGGSFHAGDGNATGNTLTINAPLATAIDVNIIGGWSSTGMPQATL